MKISCDVIQDLLPLVAENLASAASTQLVQEHIAMCPACKEQYQRLQSTISAGDLQPCQGKMALDAVKSELKNRRRTIVCLAASLVFFVLFTIFAQLTAPRYFSYSEDLISIRQSENGEVYGTFASEVTAYQSQIYEGENGALEMELTAWTTAWDKLFGKGVQTVQISSIQQPVDVVWYCGNAQEAVVIYGPPQEGGMISLPRMVLGYYVIGAAIVAVALWAFWLVLRRHAAGKITQRLALAPTAYLIGHLCIKGFQVQSFWASRDFVMILIAGAAAYLVMTMGMRLIRQRRQDRKSVE